MKDPSRLSRPKKPPSVQKIKLLCSFNGAFVSPPFPGKLRYVGGETRLVSVDRSIGISRLLSKIAEFCPKYPSFTLKYQLPDTDNGDYGHISDPTLVSIETDEDVRCMIEEYDRVTDYRKNVRLRVFVCNGNGYEGWKTDSSFSGFYSDFKNSGAGRCSARESTFWDITAVKHVAGVRRSGDICLNNDAEPKSICGVGTQNLGGLLSPVLSETSKLTSQMVTIQNSCDSAVLEASKAKFGDGHVADVRPQISMPLVSNKSLYSCNANASTLKTQLTRPKFQSESLSTRFREGLALEDGVSSGNYDISLRMVAFPHQSHDFKLGIRNLHHVNLNGKNIMPPIAGHNGVKSHLPPVSSNKQYVNLNGENIMPPIAGHDGVKSHLPPVSSNKQYGGKAFPLASLARNYGISNKNQCVIRNLDMSGIKNRSGLLDIANRLDLGFGRKPSYGGCYAGLRPRLNISKAGQGRSNYAYLGRTMYGPREHSVVGMGNTLISPKWTRSLFECGNSRGILRERTMLRSGGIVSVDHSRGQVCLRDEFGNPNLHKNRLDCSRVQHDLLEPEKTYHHLGNHPYMCGDVMKNPIPCPGVKTSGRDHLWTSNATKCNIQSPFMFNNPTNNALHYSAPCTECSQYPLVSVDSCFPCSAKLQSVQLCETLKAAVKDSSNGQNPHDKTSADLSVHQPLFSPSDKVASPTFYTSLHISEGSGTDRDLLMHDQIVENRTSISALDDTSPRCRTAPQYNQMDIMDDCLPSMEPLRENLNAVGGITLNIPIKCVTKLESLLKLSGPSSTTVALVSFSSGKTVGCEEEKKQNTSSSFNVVEKANRWESGCNSEVVNGTASNLAAFYTHLPTGQLQTIKHSDLEEIRELGSGSFGTVFYGKWKGSDVAIKRLKPTCFSGDDVGEERLIADFWKEAYLLGQLHHPNVVALYGVVTDGPATNLATVTEYMVNGSLKQVLRRKDRIIDRRKRLIIAMDVAFGMEYLHEKNIVHFDLKSHNLLVNMRDPLRPVCKIGDLGLSKVKKRTLVSGGVRGTLPWMAPELLKSGSSMVTEKVDVYSFGVVMWELLTGEEPYANMRSEEIIAGIIKGDLRPEIPHWCDPTWRSLMERCWSSDPDSRPSFSEIAKELRAISAAMNI